MLNFLLNPELWVLTLVTAVPIAYAAIGGTFSERGGVVNISMEGMMLTAAFVAVASAHAFQSAWLGLLAGIISGCLMALLFSWATVKLLADHVVIGMAVNIMALGLTGYLLVAVYGYNGTPVDTPSLPVWHIPFLAKIPVFGPALAQESVLTYLLLPTLLFAHYVLFHTPFGLRLRSVGENPFVARTAGINVRLLKTYGVLLSGFLSGLAGAYLSIGMLNSFTYNMTAGRGYIALAAMIFGNWRPVRAFGASILFGFATALSIQLQGTLLPKDLVLTLPYILTIVAVAGVVGRTMPPAADGLPYDEEKIG